MFWTQADLNMVINAYFTGIYIIYFDSTNYCSRQKQKDVFTDTKQWQNQSLFVIRPIDCKSEFFLDPEPETVSTSIFDRGTVPFNCVKKDSHERIEARNAFCLFETEQAAYNTADSRLRFETVSGL